MITASTGPVLLTRRTVRPIQSWPVICHAIALKVRLDIGSYETGGVACRSGAQQDVAEVIEQQRAGTEPSPPCTVGQVCGGGCRREDGAHGIRREWPNSRCGHSPAFRRGGACGPAMRVFVGCCGAARSEGRLVTLKLPYVPWELRGIMADESHTGALHRGNCEGVL